MSEKPVYKELNKAKSAACKVLTGAGYQIEKAHNHNFCLTAGRDLELRIVAIGTSSVVTCRWFVEQVRRLEKFSCPNIPAIKKEVWIRGKGEHAFQQFSWKGGAWVDENQEPVNIFN